MPLGCADIERRALFGDRERGGIPARGDEALDLAMLAVVDVDHGHIVVVGVGGEQELSPRVIGQCVGRRTLRGSRVERRRQGFDHLQRAGVDHRDGVVAGANHEQPAVRRGEHVVRVWTHRDGLQRLAGHSVDHADRAVSPVGDEEAPAIRRKTRLVRGDADGDAVDDAARLGTENDHLAELVLRGSPVDRVEQVPPRIELQTGPPDLVLGQGRVGELAIGGEPTASIGEGVDRGDRGLHLLFAVGVAAGYVEGLAVARPSKTEPRRL